MPPINLIRFFCALSIFPLIGCGAGVVPVKGTVSFDGVPGADIRILFQPVSDGLTVPESGTAKTDRQGNFSLLSTETGKNGVAPGEYAVFMSWEDPNIPLGTPEGMVKSNACPYSIPDKARFGQLRFTVPEKGPGKADFAFTKTEMEETIPHE